MIQILTLAMKDLTIMFRDKSGFFFTFIFPIVIAVLFGSIFGGDNNSGTRTMTVLIVDEDSTTASQSFVKQLDDASEINVVPSTITIASERVRLGKNTAYIAIKKGYGDATQQMFWGDPPEIEIGVDPARRAESAMLQGILMKYGSKRFQDTFSNPGKMLQNLNISKEAVANDSEMDTIWKNNLSQLFSDLDRFFEFESTQIEEFDEHSVDSPLTSGENNVMLPLLVTQKNVAVLKSGPINSYAVSFPQGIIWGIIGVAAAFGISIVVERTQGTMQRLRIAPISLGQVLAGKAAACFTAIIAIDFVLVMLAVTAFGVQINSLVLLLFAMLSSAICFTGIMMLLSVLGKTERSVGGIGWAVLLILSMIGGGMVPLMFMPGWMKTVGTLSPVKWTIMSFEGVMWRGFSLSEMLMPMGILLSMGVVSFFIGVVVMKKTS